MKKTFYALCAVLIFLSIQAADAASYCTANGNITSYEYIDAISINGTKLSSGNNNGYLLHPSMQIPATGSIDLILSPGFASSSYTEHWGVWVDWNQDGTFATGEQVFSGSGNQLITTSFAIPASALSGETRMRVAMQWGSAPQACGSFTYGEVEDIPLVLGPAYQLSVASDYTVYRTGPLDAAVTWVVEKDGQVVLSRNGKYNLSLKYWSLTSGSSFRIWLKQYQNGAYETVSDIIEFTVGETFAHQLSVDTNYQLTRSGIIGDPLTWVIEKDGVVVLERNAANELNYTYFNNTAGAHFKVWLKQFINGAYKRVSNRIEYIAAGQVNYKVTLDQSHRAVRSSFQGQPVLWQVVKDGVSTTTYPAGTKFSWVDYDHQLGSTYAVSLISDDSTSQVVSNVATYTVDDITPTHTLGYANGILTRSGTLGESLTWVIEENGALKLERNASNELQYYPVVYAGRSYRFWLTQYINGGYQRVSNIVIYQN